MAASTSGTSWGALLLAAFLLLLVSPADGRRHLIRRGLQRRQHQHQQHHFQQNVTLGLNPGSYHESGPWGPWTTNSSCSRTCGGGVAYQTRVCEDFRADGTHGCVGPSKRYFSCNVEECPDYTKDFREEQCARFNSIAFEGRYYSWVPYYKAANPCELNCRPIGERFYYRHSPKTIDGTRCHDDGSLDVCVNGACMPVGCDKMLGSDAVEDKCGKCRGDGTSCSTIEGVFDTDNLEVGESTQSLYPLRSKRETEQILMKSGNVSRGSNVCVLPEQKGNCTEYFERWYYNVEEGRCRQFYYSGCGGNANNFASSRDCEQMCGQPAPTDIADEEFTLAFCFMESEAGPCRNMELRWFYDIKDGVCREFYYGGCKGNPNRFRSHQECEEKCYHAQDPCDLPQVPGNCREMIPQWFYNPVTYRCQEFNYSGCQGNANRFNDRESCELRCPPLPTEQPVDHVTPLDGYTTATEEQSGGRAEGSCEATKFGCCQDKIREAKGPDFEGCGNCSDSLFGCCGDNWTFALGPSGEGCGVVTEFGCCRDNVTAASADGCLCNGTMHGCCPDNVPIALGSDFEGCTCDHCAFGCCPDKKTAAHGPQFEGCVNCTNTTFGCCPDEVTAAQGPNFEGCKGFDANCTNTTFGCCPGGVNAAEDENFAGCVVDCESTPFGCCPDGLTPATGIGFEGCDNCSESLYGCCADNASFVLGPGGEGCCFHTQFGCCQDNKTEAQGPDFAGCSCHTTPHGCCPDGVSTARGPWYYGCTCHNYPFGCCKDEHTPAWGPNFEGCLCSRLQYGCCLDDLTPARGPNLHGCSCQITPFGCCLDNHTPAQGPNFAGCGCATMPYGCCPDQRTPARGPAFGGCPCTAMPYGCCPDQHTAAQGPDGMGCECEKLAFGCCPDGRTAATGPSLTGCTCHHYPHGCCHDGRTHARGPDADGCTCALTAYGCCPDGVTTARGRNFEGCPMDPRITANARNVSANGYTTATGEESGGRAEGSCEATKFGCCQDKIREAKGPDFEGCGNCSDSLFGCCGDNCTFALGPSGEGCGVVTEFGCCRDNVTAASADGCLCNGTMHGCCPDNVPIALGPDFEGCTCDHCAFGCCPDKKTAADGPEFEGCVNCTNTTFGCCPDEVTASLGPNFEGCEGFEANCTNTTFGCCPDGLSAAEGENFAGCVVACESTPFGCCPDGLTPASGIGFAGCDNCSESLYGCCADNSSFVLGPDGEGCCFHTEFGCCHDNKTEAQGPEHAGCSCHTTPHGCCPDGVSTARGPRYYGCTCHNYPFGCCKDEHTPAWGPNFEGCLCSRLQYGCCLDDLTPARGPNLHGCSCQTTPFGCCLDNRTHAQGPNLAGCGCETMPYGCCSDQRTPARGPAFGGCPCTAMPYGCCPDQQTAAQGPDGMGCECEKLAYGCCPDGRTPARGPDADGCTCALTAYGCCPDGVTAARGRNFEGCPLDTKITAPARKVSATVCGLPEDQGPCRNYSVNWFFSVADGRCTRFFYGGCEGNGNRFNSQDECEDTCVKPRGPDACVLPKVVGSCDGQYEHWYFDTTTRSCVSFMYGGCLGNNNRFTTKDLCEQTCLHQETLDPCELSVSPGPCRGSFPRFYYDRQDNRCKQFTFGGCQGNSNNFATEEQCSERCVRLSAHEICILPKEEGRCLSTHRKWYYDYLEERCKEFVYTGCLGNRNRFDTRQRCERMCNSTRVAVSRDVCAQPKQEGPCSGAIVHWYYNMAAGRCEQFYYGGCQGNANRFENRRDCQRACISSGGPNVCMLPQEAGKCVDFRERWYYNAEEGRCHRFYYGGCDGNANNFGSHLECEQVCRQPGPTDVAEEEFRLEFCFMASEAGPCKNMEFRWFYDKEDGVCREFYYGGCQGNRNRFRTHRECEEKCYRAQDLCTLPKVPGSCSGQFVQWFYDPETDRCHEFAYSGCQGNANRFNDRESCEGRCRKGAPLPNKQPVDRATAPVSPTRRTPKPGRTDKAVVCKMMVDAGQCEKMHARWFYDAKTGRCLPFVYTGCEGNKNRFRTKEICMSFCQGVTMDTPDSELDEDKARMVPGVPLTRREPPDLSEELDLRNKPPMLATPVPNEEQATEPLPQQTAAPECPPSYCEELQCPLGKHQTVDHRGCVQCRCSNPCETFSCQEEELCRIEAYQSADGRPNYRPICRLVHKPGHCPVVEFEVQPAAVVRADCREVCRVDADCPGVRKCCYNGCAHVCVLAVVTALATPHHQPPQLPSHHRNGGGHSEAVQAKPEVTANAGSDVTLPCLDRPFATVHVSWTFRDESVESNEGRFKILVDHSLHISQLSGDDAGPYRCTADDGHRTVSHVTNLVVYVPAIIRPSTPW